MINYCWERKTVTTRKEHTCFVCNRKIPKGSAVLRWACIILSKWFSDWVCPGCDTRENMSDISRWDGYIYEYCREEDILKAYGPFARDLHRDLTDRLTCNQGQVNYLIKKIKEF